MVEFSCNQPHADQALLQTEKPEARVGIADDALKLNIVGPDFKENPTVSSAKTCLKHSLIS